MGVDIGCYLIYGINTEWHEFEDEEEFCKDDSVKIKVEDINKYNLTFENDAYDDTWGVIGIKLLDQDAEKFAENVRTSPEKFKEFADKYNIDLEKYEPGFDLDAYYW